MTDEYRLKIPILSCENEIIQNASQSYDFIGLNYYSHNFLKFQLFSTPHVNVAFSEKEIKTDMPYTMYAQGFYDAIESVSKLKKPVIITENGVADREDKIRSEWITDYLNQLVIALDNGIDIRGYFYWSLFLVAPVSLLLAGTHFVLLFFWDRRLFVCFYGRPWGPIVSNVCNLSFYITLYV